MRQVWITKAGPPEVLQVREAPDPSPGEGEVRVRVKAAGINFADLMARVGLYPDAPKLPCVIGYVDRSFSFEDAPKAHHYLHDRKARGKVLLVP